MEKSLETVKKEVRSVLNTSPKAVPLKEFLKAYKDLLNSRLPSREFGYTLDIDFLHSLKDVVHIETDKTGTYQLQALADKDTAHIQKMVLRQRDAKGRNNGRHRRSTEIARPRNQSFPVVTKPCAQTARNRPFIPAKLRSEIIQVVKQYREGISYAPFLMAYQSVFKRPPDFCWLSPNEREKFQQLANVIPELEIKVVNGQDKLHFVGQDCPTERLTNGNASGKVAGLPTIIAAKQEKDTSSVKSQDSNGLTDVSPVPQFVKYNIEKLLKQHPEGILAVHFPTLYENFTKKTFDLHELGYNSLSDLVDALPEIFVTVRSPDNANNWKVYHVDFSDNIKDARQAAAITKAASNQQNSRLSYSKEIPGRNIASVISRERSKNTPCETAPPVMQYMQAELPENATEKFFPVFVSAIITPGRFWFQLKTETAKATLEKLEKEIEYFYNSQDYGTYRLRDVDMLIGCSCVAQMPDNQWYRCQISAFLNAEIVKVYLVDYGSWDKVSRKNLYYVKYSFILVPAQAFQAQLAYVQPADKDEWNSNAETHFLEFCNKPYIMAKVDSELDQVHSIILCDNVDGRDVYIHEALVNEGLAEYYPLDGTDESMNDSRLSENQTPTKKISNESNIGNNIESSPSPQKPLTNGYNIVKTKKVISKLKKIHLSKSRKVRRIILGDGYQIYILVVEEAAYVSGDDLCNLLWKGQDAVLLIGALSDVTDTIPTLSVSKAQHADLFSQCERYKVGGFSGTDNRYSVILFPLKYSLKVLNIFGHHSLKVRETLIREIRQFNPRASVWESSEVNGEHYEESIDHSEESNEDRLCAHDLIYRLDALECRRDDIVARHKEQPDENFSTKMKNNESLRNRISQRIKEIEEICLKYNEETCLS